MDIGHPFSDKVDAKQAAATHSLQLRPCVSRRHRETLASSDTRNVRTSGDIVANINITTAIADDHQPMHPCDGLSHYPCAPLLQTLSLDIIGG